jgi:glycosyltransferase involved in cell wall biosynthesis
MFDGTRVAVVVPAFNEARLIGRTLDRVPAFVDQIVVVDDGSTDDTAARARSSSDPRIAVFEHATNRGVGAAIASGYRAAFLSGADIAVVMAGDAQMDPADLPALLAPLVRGEADYTKGDRLSYPRAHAEMPVTRFFGNHALSALTRLVTGLPVRDSQCGYTALSRRAEERLGVEELWPRYGYPNDLLGRAAAAGLRVRDVTVRPVYADEASGVGLRHALFVVPWVLARVAGRRAGALFASRPLDATALSTIARDESAQ